MEAKAARAKRSPWGNFSAGRGGCARGGQAGAYSALLGFSDTSSESLLCCSRLMRS